MDQLFYPQPVYDIVPPGKSGNVEIEHGIGPGGRKVTLLKIDGVDYMNDGPEECADLGPFVDHANGKNEVLILGLGIGLAVCAITAMHVTVVEKSFDVIRLVKPCLEYSAHLFEYPKRDEVVHMDAFEFETERKFDSILIDIWPTDNPAYAHQAAALKKRYEGFLAPGGKIFVWREDRIMNRQMEASHVA